MQFCFQVLLYTSKCGLRLFSLQTFLIYALLVLFASFICIFSFPASLLGPVILLPFHTDKYSVTVQRNDGADLKTIEKQWRNAKLRTAGG